MGKRKYIQRSKKSSKSDDHKPFIPVQAKMLINQPNDSHEAEADRMADNVVSGSKTDGAIHSASPVTPSITPVQLKQDTENASKSVPEEKIQTKQQPSKPSSSKPKTAPVSGINDRLNATKGAGSGLSGDVKNEMESGFGADFSDVRIHQDTNAVQMSEELNAHAFTHGSDIYFNQSQYKPETTEGKALLAHELTHTIQQKGGEKKSPHTNEQAIEQDANTSTEGVFRKLASGVTGFGKMVMPKLKSGFKIARCSKDISKEKKLRMELDKIAQENIRNGKTSFKEMDKKEGHDNKTFNSYHLWRMLNYRNGNWDRENTAVHGYGVNDYHDCVTSFGHTFDALYNMPFKSFNFATVEKTKGANGKNGAFEIMTEKGYISASKDFTEYTKTNVAGTENNPNVTHFKESPAAWALKQSKVPGIHVFGASLNEGFHAMNLIVDTRGGGEAEYYLQDQHKQSAALDRSIPHTAKEIDHYFIEFSQVNSSAKGYRKVKLFKLKRIN